MQHLSSATSAALMVVATLMIFLPELRTLPMRLAFGVLWVGVVGTHLRRTFKAGMLTKTPGQILRMAARPRVDPLVLIAILVGSVAIALSAA